MQWCRWSIGGARTNVYLAPYLGLCKPWVYMQWCRWSIGGARTNVYCSARFRNVQALGSDWPVVLSQWFSLVPTYYNTDFTAQHDFLPIRWGHPSIWCLCQRKQHIQHSNVQPAVDPEILLNKPVQTMSKILFTLEHVDNHENYFAEARRKLPTFTCPKCGTGLSCFYVRVTVIDNCHAQCKSVAASDFISTAVFEH